MKHLLIRLNIRDGEREYTYQCLHITGAKNIVFVANRFAASFWGDSERNGNGWDAWGGEIHIQLSKVTEITQDKYLELFNLFH